MSGRYSPLIVWIALLAGMLGGCKPATHSFLIVQVCLGDEQNLTVFKAWLQSIASMEHMDYSDGTPGVSGPGGQRIVIGQNGELYFTPDHYKTFIPLNWAINMQPFIFISDVMALRATDVRVVEVPGDLSDKGALLSWYAEALGLPEYFGANWDAFDACLRDLSWINERRLVLYHRDTPLKGSAENQKIYIEVLANAVRDWKPGEEHEVIAAFDPACELKIRAVIRDGSGVSGS